MWHKILSFFSFLFLVVLSVILLHACANIASPTGGPYDVDPTKVKRANPDFNSLRATQTRIEIEFDENIKIKTPSEKVIITPPQKVMPVIRSLGKKAVVEIKDSLLPNTTYTIDFTDAIADNNEENPLENFVFSFSTGEQLDTLAVSGKVITAENLEPVTGIYVGIHSKFEDTVFTRVPFERISRTDSRGNFTVRGMAPGKYKVFALKDLNRDYKYDNPQESIAFLDSIIIPSTMPAVRQDTIYKDSLTIDSILTVHYTRFLPDDLLLRSFDSDFQREYLQKHERTDSNKLTLFFAAPTALANFTLLEPEVSSDNWYVMERSAGNDTLLLWITDSLIYKQDTIRMKVDYTRTDSLNMNFIDTDTLTFSIRKSARDRRTERREREKNEKEEKENAIRFLGIKSNIQATFDLFNPLRLEFEQPLVAFDSSLVRLEKAVDSLFEVVPYRLESDTLNPRKYTLRPRWEPGAKYKLTVDSASLVSRYGIWNNKYEQSFTMKELDQYGNLEVTIIGLPEGKTAFVELLDKTDKPFRKSFVKGNQVRFQDLLPSEEVYARMVIDDNGDGEWTTGNYEEKRQPEIVYYYPGKWTIRAYTDHTEEWNIEAVPMIRQKPLEITKNKPEEKKRRDPNQDRNNQQQNQQNSSFGFGGGRGSGGFGGM